MALSFIHDLSTLNLSEWHCKSVHVCSTMHLRVSEMNRHIVADQSPRITTKKKRWFHPKNILLPKLPGIFRSHMELDILNNLRTRAARMQRHQFWITDAPAKSLGSKLKTKTDMFYLVIKDVQKWLDQRSSTNHVMLVIMLMRAVKFSDMKHYFLCFVLYDIRWYLSKTRDGSFQSLSSCHKKNENYHLRSTGGLDLGPLGCTWDHESLERRC